MRELMRSDALLLLLLRVWFWAGVALTLAGLSLGLCSLAHGAPAPFERREAKPAPLALLQPGRWDMDWCGCSWDVELWGDGAYRGRCGEYGEAWTGTWSFDPQTRVLRVSEASESGCLYRWEATLDAALSGKVAAAGGGVRLARR